ncbi:MAG TPA: helix-turn-helix domain-containing protein [Nocardioides sp.]
MPHTRSRRGSPAAFDFEGTGDEAREWLDSAYGTTFQLTGPVGTVRHHRADHGSFAVDHVKIDAEFAFEAEPMPALVVVDMIRGDLEYTRDHVTDLSHDGDSVLVAGWNMPFHGNSNGYEIRTTSLSAEALTAAVAEVDPDYPWQHISFSSYVPRSPAAGARWRATVDQLGSVRPGVGSVAAADEASRLLGHTLLQTFPNNVVAEAGRLMRVESRRATPSLVREAVRIVEAHPTGDLALAELAEECGVTTRTLQYAFRQHLGCTPSDYLRRVRLDLVRQALRDGSTLTVSDAAARFGFFNPGRFASDYRQVFDENPGQTLLRSGS